MATTVVPRYRYVHEYLTWVQDAFARVRAGGRVKIHWSDDPMDLAAFSREFLAALHDRINLKGGMGGGGRKWTAQYQTGLYRDRHRLQDIGHRIRVYQFETPEITKRFGHLLSHFDGD